MENSIKDAEYNYDISIEHFDGSLDRYVTDLIEFERLIKESDFHNFKEINIKAIEPLN